MRVAFRHVVSVGKRGKTRRKQRHQQTEEVTLVSKAFGSGHILALVALCHLSFWLKRSALSLSLLVGSSCAHIVDLWRFWHRPRAWQSIVGAPPSSLLGLCLRGPTPRILPPATFSFNFLRLCSSLTDLEASTPPHFLYLPSSSPHMYNNGTLLSLLVRNFKGQSH